MDQNFGLHSHIMENASSDLAEIREILESTRFIPNVYFNLLETFYNIMSLIQKMKTLISEQNCMYYGTMTICHM